MRAGAPRKPSFSFRAGPSRCSSYNNPLQHCFIPAAHVFSHQEVVPMRLSNRCSCLIAKHVAGFVSLHAHEQLMVAAMRCHAQTALHQHAWRHKPGLPSIGVHYVMVFITSCQEGEGRKWDGTALSRGRLVSMGIGVLWPSHCDRWFVRFGLGKPLAWGRVAPCTHTLKYQTPAIAVHGWAMAAAVWDDLCCM